MFDEDIRKLTEEPGRSLDRLEADIWAGVEARIRANRLSRALFSCQAAVLSLALVGSIAAGMQAAMAVSPGDALAIFSPRADLSPSSRLIGRGP